MLLLPRWRWNWTVSDDLYLFYYLLSIEAATAAAKIAAEADEAAAADQEANEPQDEAPAAEGDEEEEEQEQEDDDMQIAWETLDAARILYLKRPDLKNEDLLRVADIHLTLGDISLESENWDQAITDFMEALELKTRILPSTSRQFAELHYKIALVYDYKMDYANAKEHLERSITVLKAKKEELKAVTTLPEGDKGKGKMTEETVDKESEIGEINELMAEIQARVCL